MGFWKNLFRKEEQIKDAPKEKSNNALKEEIKNNDTKADDTKVLSFKGIGTENKIINSIYNDRLAKLNMWRQRYSKTEYPYKVALNTVYQMLTLIEAWDYILSSFNQGKIYNDFQNAYNVVQKKSGDIALAKVHNIVESKIHSGGNISLLDINMLNGFVSKAQKGDNEFVEKVELCYFWYTGAAELAYAYAAFGLIGLSKMEAMQQISSIIIGGNPDELDNALGMFGTNIEMCYKKLQALW